ncbi:hypothetical protein B9G55_07575 [Saccharibacillus sp. O16]|nr:hypothetical protein B9G55_07575 [Saccharibacillus sp. O16]
MAFDSSQQALRAEMLLDERQITFNLIPTPAGITAGCALSLAFAEGELEEILDIVRAENVQMRGIFRRTESAYEPLI